MLTLQKTHKESLKKLVKKKKNFENKKGKIRIFVRIKGEAGKAPIVLKKSKTHVAILSRKTGSRTKQKLDQRNFHFEKIFSETSSQADIFDEIEGLPEQLLSAENICIFAYGATGTGKTFSLLGTKSQPGLLFRCLDKLHEVIHERKKSLGIRVRVTEIYLEQVRNITDHFESKFNRSRLEGLHWATFKKRLAQDSRHCLENSHFQGNLAEHAFFQVAFIDPVRAGENVSEALGAANGRVGQCRKYHVCGFGGVGEIRREFAEERQSIERNVLD